jgi:hypothetical protein
MAMTSAGARQPAFRVDGLIGRLDETDRIARVRALRSSPAAGTGTSPIPRTAASITGQCGSQGGPESRGGLREAAGGTRRPGPSVSATPRRIGKLREAGEDGHHAAFGTRARIARRSAEGAFTMRRAS